MKPFGDPSDDGLVLTITYRRTLPPKIILDTSAINALEDHGADSAPLMRTLAWEFEVILAFTSLEELISTPASTERYALVRRFERLRRPGTCLVPPHEMIRLMIKSHAEAPERFDWKDVDVRMSPDCESLIAQQDYLGDIFSAEQRIEQRGFEKEFKRVLKSVRPRLDEIPAQERPSSYEELVASDQVHGRFVWNLIRGIYQTVSGRQLTAPEANEFVEVCPPVRALGFGQLMGFFAWSLRGQRGRKGSPAGRNDLAMAGYLPYGDFFITNDTKQRQALSEVAGSAQTTCRVLSYEEFRRAITG